MLYEVTTYVDADNIAEVKKRILSIAGRHPDDVSFTIRRLGVVEELTSAMLSKIKPTPETPK